MIKFLSKFQIEVLLQCYKRAEKAIKIKHVVVIVKRFDKS